MTAPQDELPILTEISDDSEAEEYPILTSVVAPTDLSATGAHDVMTRPLNPAEVHHLLHQLETHLETVFTQKLNSQLEQLQRLAVELAISEFKAELPQLIIDALKNSDKH